MNILMKVLLFMLLLPFKLVAFVLFCVMTCLQVISTLLGGLVAVLGLIGVAGSIVMIISMISKSESINVIIAMAIAAVAYSLITVFASSIPLVLDALSGALVKFVVYVPMRGR
jgi:hypothetical protein